VYLNVARGQEPAAALESVKISHAILADLVAQSPQNPQFRRDLAAALRELGVLQAKAGDREHGLNNLRQSVEQFQQLIEQFPKDDDLNEELKKSRDELNNALAPTEIRAA